MLVVEDDRMLAEDLGTALTKAGHRVSIAGDLAEARRLANAAPYAIVILDRLLPGADGLEFIPWLREHGRSASVLVLSALDETESKIQGLEAGADDYLGKPYVVEEVLARVAALARRNGPTAHRLHAGRIALDRLTRRATVNDEGLALNHREFSLLEYLMLHLDETVTRTMIMRDVWGYDLEPGTNVVDVHVSRLRAKLEAHGCANQLATERGAGYRLGHAAS